MGFQWVRNIDCILHAFGFCSAKILPRCPNQWTRAWIMCMNRTFQTSRQFECISNPMALSSIQRIIFLIRFVNKDQFQNLPLHSPNSNMQNPSWILLLLVNQMLCFHKCLVLSSGYMFLIHFSSSPPDSIFLSAQWLSLLIFPLCNSKNLKKMNPVNCFLVPFYPVCSVRFPFNSILLFFHSFLPYSSFPPPEETRFGLYTEKMEKYKLLEHELCL